MAAASKRMREQLLDLGWSLWTGLGVPGQIDEHADHCIDPEALIVFTAALGDADPRLRDEATDWCIRYGNLVSGARLKNLLANENDQVRSAYGEFAATVGQHSSLRWPEQTTARRHQPRERPRIQAFNRASQVIFRLRGLMGVSARAEIVRAFLALPETAFSAADLAAETAYTKRNVAQVLDALRLGDVVQAFPIRNQIHFRMPRERLIQLREQLEPVPSAFVRWSAVLHVLPALQDLLERIEGEDNDVRAVEARAFAENIVDSIRFARLPPPRRDLRGAEYWNEFVAWALAAANNLAIGNEPAGDRFKARRSGAQ